MFLLGQRVVWSASDLAAASECEFRVARRLDARLRRVDPLAEEDDPLTERIATLGDTHEDRLLDGYASAGTVQHVERPTGRLTEQQLTDLHHRSLATLATGAVVYQPGFYDGEFHGYADFLEPTDDGWVVADAKLARVARPRAMLQVAAYADQLAAAGHPVAPVGVLLLGDGHREEVPLRDVLPVFRARRERLRHIIRDRLAAPGPLPWGDDEHTVCGTCPECEHEITAHEDTFLVAGLRRDHRRHLAAAGIRTIRDLAGTATTPDGLDDEMFARLRAQARLQVRQLDTGDVSYEPVGPAPDGTRPATLPPPSPGDVFFDFEGDPFYSEDHPTPRHRLEYLWGSRLATGAPGDGEFVALWAHDHTQEQAALHDFIALVRERLTTHPDMHVYHYAPYETAALKRLTGRYGVLEDELDDLLRRDVFVDLYAVTRRAVVVSQPSYSIKKLEPLYMGDELRGGDVQAGDVSVVEYHQYRVDRENGDIERADARLKELHDYNAYDCLSTQRLRDWLLDQDLVDVVHDVPSDDTDADAGDADAAPSELQQERARLTPLLLARADRTTTEDDARGWRLLAAAVGYHRREDLPFWWDHFHRLNHPARDWPDSGGVFVVGTAEVTEDWAVTGRQRNPRRTLRLTGTWAPGSGTPSTACALYALPGPDDAAQHAVHAWAKREVAVTVPDPDDPGVVEVVETGDPHDPHDLLPVALTPVNVRSDTLERAIHRYADRSLAASPDDAAWHLLTRRPPRTTGPLPPLGEHAPAAVTAAVRALDSSYLAVQGPPGSGKSWTAAQVIRTLVTEHGWTVGVVAQSHAVVENLLAGVVEHGVPRDQVAKGATRTADPTWTTIKGGGKEAAAWVERHRAQGRGGVVGGTAWTFVAEPLTGALDLLVVDEAGQFSLANTVAVAPAARNLLLLGDPQQLPQVSQGQHPEPVDTSALGWLMGEHATLPDEYGYFLPTSYRMCAEVCGPVSHLAYEGRLTSSAPVRDLAGVMPGIRTVEVPHTANRTSSAQEAEAVADLVDGLLGTAWTDGGRTRPLEQRDVLVVAAFNAQVDLLSRVLARRGHPDVRVGTVDRFQGQQAPVAVLSMAASSPRDVPRGMGFLLNRNRINVAVSRAQWQAVVVHSPALTHFMPSTVADLLDLGGFLALLEAGT